MKNSTVFTQFERYLLTEKRVSENTFSAYKSDLRQFERFLNDNNIDIFEVLYQDLQKFLAFMRDQNLSARSAARKIATLKAFFSYTSQRLGIKNPAQELKIPSIKKSLPNVISEQDIENLFEIAEQDVSYYGKRNVVMLYMMYCTGMRVSELVSLEISHIQSDTGCIQVDGKGGRQRIIPVPDSVLSMLKVYIKKNHSLFSSKHGKTDFLFPIVYSKQIKPISRQSFWGIIQTLWKKAEINRPISPHTLRHSFATHMLKKGANLRSLQILLGHENIATVEIYTHVENSYLRAIYDKKHPRS